MCQLLNVQLMRVVIALCIVWIRTATHARVRLISGRMRWAINAILHLGLHASARSGLSLTGHRMIGKGAGHHAGCRHCLQACQHKQCEDTAAKAAVATKVTQDCHGNGKLSTATLNRDSDSVLIRNVFQLTLSLLALISVPTMMFLP